MKTPLLETERLILRPLKKDDAEAVFNNWSSNPETTRFVQFNTHLNIRETEEWLSSEEKAVCSENNYNWGFVLKKSGMLIGSGGITYNKEHQMFELGYIIMHQHWGCGITSEAVQMIITFARSELGLQKLFGKHAKENTASERVMEKHGFVYQNAGKYAKLNGDEEFESREYILYL
jgi:[ribosomal protein S5]-alanine N-acetyltransferase